MNEEAMIYFWKSTDGNSVYFNTDPEEAKKTATQQSRKQAARLMNGTPNTRAQHVL